MSFGQIKPGAVVTEVYYAVSESSVPIIGAPHTTWASAVEQAQARLAHIQANLLESLRGFASEADLIERAKSQVSIDLRWKIRSPDGTTLDTVIERYEDVSVLRVDVPA